MSARRQRCQTRTGQCFPDSLVVMSWPDIRGFILGLTISFQSTLAVQNQTDINL